MTDNVINMGKWINEYVCPEDVLESINSESLETIIIIGKDKNGNDYFASSHADAAVILFEIEMFKAKLIERFMD